MASSYQAKQEDGPIPGPGSGTTKSKQPDNTAFKQQRLPAWQPILTAGTVLPAFFLIGLLFIPVGIGLYVTSNNIQEFQVRARDPDLLSTPAAMRPRHTEHTCSHMTRDPDILNTPAVT